MDSRVVPLLTPLAVVSFILWLAVESRPETHVGAEVDGLTPPSIPEPAPAPCQEPIPWRIAYVDPGFGVEADAVDEAAREAAELWTLEARRPLFVRDTVTGMPIRLVYDARQARTDERVRAQEVQRSAEVDLAVEQRELERASAAYTAEMERSLSAWAAHDAHVATHNAAVRRWNAAGDAPPDTLAALEARETYLRGQRTRLLDAARTLQAAEMELRNREAALAERHAALDGDRTRLAASFPALEVESGTYLEVRGVDIYGADRPFREIRVFRFESRADLVRVLAHELGHALGLPHLEEAGAVMSPRREYGEEGRLALHAADRAALEALCR